jgi:hypothetical protein
MYEFDKSNPLVAPNSRKVLSNFSPIINAANAS